MDPRYEWFTGEPDASKVRKSGSEGGSWKPALRSTVPVERRHDDRQGAGCLPYFGCDTKSPMYLCCCPRSDLTAPAVLPAVSYRDVHHW
jgi:hypothetical protein